MGTFGWHFATSGMWFCQLTVWQEAYQPNSLTQQSPVPKICLTKTDITWLGQISSDYNFTICSIK